MARPISAVDLFCGAGGLTHGFQLEGINVRAGVDSDPVCEYPFEHNNNAVFLEIDAHDITAKDLLPFFLEGECKLLAGCAPCQPFSTYSQGHRNDDDEEWMLLYEFGRLVKGIRPQVVTMENVTKLVKHPVFADFIRMLKKSGYLVTHYEVECAHYGVPQNRERLVLFASMYGEIEIEKPSHDESNFVTVRDTIGGLKRIAAGEVSKSDPLHRASNLSEINMKRIQASRPGGTWRDWDKDLLTKCHKKKSGKTYPSVYGRMEWDKPAPTITTQCHGYGNGRFGHPEQDRAISLREAALIQTFPENYSFTPSEGEVHFSTIGRLIGNAVPVRLARMIARSILSHVEKYDA
ncbi:MAG: DNA cytosine methyltransferase [Blastocatellia bacterium]|nr:DNA cytosine methyltransferase [Blastocatellia bacterium]